MTQVRFIYLKVVGPCHRGQSKDIKPVKFTFVTQLFKDPCQHGIGGIIKGGLELHCVETNYDHQVSLDS
jgi:hypothetical protein